MRRSNTRDAAGRAGLLLTRGTVRDSDTSGSRTTLDVNGLHGDQPDGLEHFQQYGFASVPAPADGNGAPEVLLGALGGNASHQVVLGSGDRRFKPKDWKPGESGMYDSQKQVVHLSKDGIKLNGGENNKPVTIQVGGATITQYHDKTIVSAGGVKFAMKDNNIYLGDENASQRVMLQGGPSTKIYGV